MRTPDLKSLANTISSVVDPTDDRTKMLAEGYINSLTEKARQVFTESEKEEKNEKPDDMEDIIKRLAAKALKRAKKKARRPSGDDAYAGANPKAAKSDPDMKNAGAIAEVAAPGYEKWASDPKVKASFKKQYGNRWKQVMYGRSWNMKKMDEEVEELDELSKKTLGSYINKSMKDYGELSAYKEMVGPGLSDEAERKMKNRKRGVKRATAILTKEDVDLAEGGDSAKRMRILRKGKPVKGAVKDFMDRSFKKKFYKNKTRFGGETPAVLGRARLKHAAMKAKGLAEAEQLDEAGYKKLMRLRGKAYDTGNPKIARAAAELQSKVAARMAMKGGASAEAVKGGGSIIGKSGKYTKKAGNLANQRSKGIANFRNLVVDRGISRDTGVGSVKAMADRLQKKKPQMTPAQVAKKREAQAAMRDFRNRARSGDFGQNNQEGMRPLYNYLKRTGKLKTKTK